MLVIEGLKREVAKVYTHCEIVNFDLKGKRAVILHSKGLYGIKFTHKKILGLKLKINITDVNFIRSL